MEARKNPKADLNKTTGLFLNVGLVLSLLMVISAFEWRFYDDGSLVDLGQVKDEFEDMLEIPPTEQPSPPLTFQKFQNFGKFTESTSIQHSQVVP
jgi:protein TonB